MCATSMVGDFYNDRFRQWPSLGPLIQPTGPTIVQLPPVISRDEFDQLKRDVADMKELLKRAKAYDERNHEPECEIEEKMELLRKVAKLVGVDLSDVIGPAATA